MFHVNLPGCKAMKNKSKRTYLGSTQSVSPRLSWSKFGRESKKPFWKLTWLAGTSQFFKGNTSTQMVNFPLSSCCFWGVLTCFFFRQNSGRSPGKILGKTTWQGPNLLFCGLVTFNGFWRVREVSLKNPRKHSEMVKSRGNPNFRLGKLGECFFFENLYWFS